MIEKFEWTSEYKFNLRTAKTLEIGYKMSIIERIIPAQEYVSLKINLELDSNNKSSASLRVSVINNHRIPIKIINTLLKNNTEEPSKDLLHTV